MKLVCLQISSSTAHPRGRAEHYTVGMKTRQARVLCICVPHFSWLNGYFLHLIMKGQARFWYVYKSKATQNVNIITMSGPIKIQTDFALIRTVKSKLN